MHYIFIINGRDDYRERVKADLETQISKFPSLDYRFYITKGPGDATRFVRVHSDLHPKEDECYVACGGSGLVNEVVSGIIGFENKKFAIMAYGATTDFIKVFPGRNFNSLEGILKGESFRPDVIKANDYYALNVINSGFDAQVAFLGNSYIEQGMEGKKAYAKALAACLLSCRFNRAHIEVDGKRINRKWFLMCTFANGRYCGGQYLCSPEAEVNDGYMDICYFRVMTLIASLICLKFFSKGEHLTNPFCRKRLKSFRAKTARISIENELIYLCLDGELAASRDFQLEVLPNAIEMILPL